MSREIRFRAWDKFNKQMLQHNQIGVLLKNARSNTQWEYMQSTGLHDSKGKEIYEGDIIKWHHPIGPYGEMSIDFREVDTVLPQVTGHDWYLNGIEYAEVIGNIHENPELLKEPPNA